MPRFLSAYFISILRLILSLFCLPSSISLKRESIRTFLPRRKGQAHRRKKGWFRRRKGKSRAELARLAKERKKYRRKWKHFDGHSPFGIWGWLDRLKSRAGSLVGSKSNRARGVENDGIGSGETGDGGYGSVDGGGSGNDGSDSNGSGGGGEDNAGGGGGGGDGSGYDDVEDVVRGRGTDSSSVSNQVTFLRTIRGHHLLVRPIACTTDDDADARTGHDALWPRYHEYHRRSLIVVAVSALTHRWGING